MTLQVPVLRPSGFAAGSQGQVQVHRFELRGASQRLRLIQFPVGWLASVDTVEGPTLGCDRSPYLAVSRALEPMGGGLLDAMAIVSELQLAPRARATDHYAPPGSELPQS